MRKEVIISVKADFNNDVVETRFKINAVKILENLSPENIAFIAKIATHPKANERLSDKQKLIEKYVTTGRVL
jgi:hypothetical protein